jgi:hypothetical protein
VRRSVTLLAFLMLVPLAAACGSSPAGGGPLPSTIERQQAGTRIPSGPCSSWLGVGIDAAFCGAGLDAPAASGAAGQIEFTGTPRAGAEGGIAQAAGVLPEGRTIGIKVDSETTGTLVAQAICDTTLVRATFSQIRFRVGDRALIAATFTGDTPVILVKRNGREIAPDHELLVELTWMSDAPQGCAFRVA